MYSLIVQYLSRADYNNLYASSKDCNRLCKTVDPPWPSRCFGAQGSHAIESFSISHDGEYFAYANTIGNIEVWSRRTGKLIMPFKQKGRSASQSRRQTPIGNLLKFAPKGYLLACGHENRIYLFDVAVAVKTKILSSCCKILTIDQHQGACYEVTYLSFSKDAQKLIVRYGKMAYIYQIPAHGLSTVACQLLNQIPLTSSRCQMASSPCMKYVAVTNSSSSDEKGTIDVWNLEGLSTANESQPPIQEILDATRINAHRNQVIRGLAFVSCTDPMGENHWVVSCSLRGSVKFHRRYGQAGSEALYICTHEFESPGKIFSMALSSPFCPPEHHDERMYLAVGQSRGQVRVWKVNLLNDQSQDHNQEELDQRKVIKSQQPTTESTDMNSSSNDILQEFLSTEVGEHMHHDNIKLLAFSPDGRNLVASRAFEGRIWFHKFSPGITG